MTGQMTPPPAARAAAPWDQRTQEMSMSFVPKVIKEACAAGAKARAMGLPEIPPNGFPAIQKSAWRMGWAGVASVSKDELLEVINDFPAVEIDPLLDISGIEDVLSASAPFYPNWRSPLDSHLRAWEREFREMGGSLANPPAEQGDGLASFVAAHREELERLARRNPTTGGYSMAAHRARAALGLQKEHRTPIGAGRNDPIEDARLKAAGWNPVKGKPGNAWREFWPAGGIVGRVNIFASPDGWKVGLAHAGGTREYWPERFSTSDAARAAVHARLNLQRPQIGEVF